MRTNRKYSKFLVIFVSLIMIVSMMPLNAFASDNDVLKIDSLDGHFRFNPGEEAHLRVYVPLDKYTCKWEILDDKGIATLKLDPSDTSLATLQFKEQERMSRSMMQKAIRSEKPLTTINAHFTRMDSFRSRSNPLMSANP